MLATATTNATATDEASEGRNPNPVDIHVGGQIRLRRKILGMSQEQLADALGLTFQQVQKYERGANRVSASKLYATAKILGVTVQSFFDGLAEYETNDEIDNPIVHLAGVNGGVEIAEAFQAVDNQGRAAILQMSRALLSAAARKAA
ncbi:helix-turn-helix transcriptional regulator [Caulobacter sp. CCNWLY153]|uniref:helix-turn-helix domain-containing protein n=1 Tax=unclassified Caulobacter TaxID=2648921 RepID=UPI002FEFEFDD